MNINNLQFNLQEALAFVNNTTDYLLLAKTIQTLDVGQIRTVATFGSLPSASSNAGKLYWVTADERLYWSNGTVWYYFSQLLGVAYAWGLGISGQLGDGTTVDKSSPVSVVGGFTDWCQVTSGGHSLGVRINGTAWAWGGNGEGRLGDGTTVSKSSPVSVVGGFTDWCQVTSGGHSLGVRINGTAWAWGCGSSGSLGDGTTVNSSSPVSVVGGFTDWCQVSAGNSHSLGVRINGTAWAWGSGGSGRLGDGTTVNKSSPVLVVGGFVDWCQVSAGSSLSLGVRTNGTAWAWGSGSSGLLGDGTTVDKSSPVLVAGGFTNWCQVSAGLSHGLGVRTNGTAWAWGFGTCGRLGDGTTVDKSSPVSVIGGFTDWCQVSAGFSHSLGVRTNGTAWGWGTGSTGRLGNGTTVLQSSPVSVVGGFTDWCQVSAGSGGGFGVALRKIVN